MVSARRKKSSRFLPVLCRRFGASRDGAAAIEFAVLALPFFLLLFATIEVFVAFAGEQMLNHTTDQISRDIRLGKITFDTGRQTDMDQVEFHEHFCSELVVLVTCDDAGGSRLFLDVRNVDNFSDVPIGVPRAGGSLDTSDFGFDIGGAGDIHVFRAFYKWPVLTDLIRPYLANIDNGDGIPEYYLMVSTTAFRNEPFAVRGGSGGSGGSGGT